MKRQKNDLLDKCIRIMLSLDEVTNATRPKDPSKTYEKIIGEDYQN